MITETYSNNTVGDILSASTKPHLMQAKHFRAFRDRSFVEWDRVSCVQYLSLILNIKLCNRFQQRAFTNFIHAQNIIGKGVKEQLSNRLL